MQSISDFLHGRHFNLLHRLFTGQSALARIETSLRALHALHAIVSNSLPVSLRPYCHSVYWSEQTLVINITNSTAMSKIRQLCPRLLETLQQQGIDVKKIKSMIFFTHSKPTAPPKAQRMTPAALQAFQHLQQSISDPGLQQALSALLNAHQPGQKAKSKKIK